MKLDMFKSLPINTMEINRIDINVLNLLMNKCENVAVRYHDDNIIIQLKNTTTLRNEFKPITSIQFIEPTPDVNNFVETKIPHEIQNVIYILPE